MSSAVNDERICNLEKKMEEILVELASVKKINNSLKQHIKDLTLCSDDLYDTVYDLENHVNDLNQYSRRENIELQHIPESVEQKDLEKFVLNLLKSINVDIAS